MLKLKRVEPDRDRISFALNATALVALITIGALVAVSIDAPRAIPVSDEPLADTAQVFLTADGPAPQSVDGPPLQSVDASDLNR